MRILVTNDDGVFSPGLVALADVAGHFGEVLVMAPDAEQSAMGQAITIQRPLKVHAMKIGSFNAFRVNGTPADCVAMGVYQWGKPDLVLSGINLGSNLGNEIWHSGTVAAAKQAALFGVRAAAFSLMLNGGEASFDQVISAYVQRAIQVILEQDGPLLVNVNLPQEPTGILWTHQSVRSYNGQVIEGVDPMGRQIYWFGAVPMTPPDADSDRWAVEHNLVSLTPLSLDLTNKTWLTKLKSRQVEVTALSK
jgi:5'-nucleotidase